MAAQAAARLRIRQVEHRQAPVDHAVPGQPRLRLRPVLFQSVRHQVRYRVAGQEQRLGVAQEVAVEQAVVVLGVLRIPAQDAVDVEARASEQSVMHHVPLEDPRQRTHVEMKVDQGFRSGGCDGGGVGDPDAGQQPVEPGPDGGQRTAGAHAVVDDQDMPAVADPLRHGLVTPGLAAGQKSPLYQAIDIGQGQVESQGEHGGRDKSAARYADDEVDVAGNPGQPGLHEAREVGVRAVIHGFVPNTPRLIGPMLAPPR